LRKDIIVKRVRVSEIIGLRHRELRRGQSIQTAYLTGDEEPDTRHFGAVLADSPAEIICCASFMTSTIQDEPAWKLRGMATASAFQGEGIGRFLLASAEEILINGSPIRLLWCNSRAAAVGFYEKQGWQCISDIIEIPNVGPHRKMMKRIS